MTPSPLIEGDWIRGITIRQPWATCILTGAKTIENRPRPWKPSWVLLHAGQSTDRAALHTPLVARTIRGRDLATGAVIGVARIIDCHQDPDGSVGSSGYRKLRNGCHNGGSERLSGHLSCRPGCRWRDLPQEGLRARSSHPDDEPAAQNEFERSPRPPAVRCPPCCPGLANPQAGSHISHFCEAPDDVAAISP